MSRTIDGRTATDLSSFVPTIALELGERPGSHWTSVDGSMLSADISGFTALTERLAAKGKAGAEEITELVNECFVELIDAAYGYGGEIIKFGGDAIFVLFRGDEHQARCADASLLMQRVLHATKAAKRAKLTMSVGASHGPFDVFVVGSGARDLLIVGPAASRVVFLEGEAAKGETLVSDAIAAMLPTERQGRRHAGAVAILGDPIHEPMAPESRAPTSLDALAAFVPAAVADQFAAFDRLGGEHRLVTVGFVALSGVAAHLADHGPDETAAALGYFMDEVATSCARVGVTLLHTDVAPDGLKTVLCAGAPLNTGNGDDAILRVALEVADLDSPFTIRQGVARGRVFAGFLGASYRRTYTIMGDTVNTAARLLGPCEAGGILAVDDVVTDARGDFDSVSIEPFAAKGKTEMLHASRVLSIHIAKSAARTDPAVVLGRDEEVALLLDALRVSGENNGRIVEIVAPAGVGKSHLLAAASEGIGDDVAAFRGGCTPYGAATPYGLARDLLRSGFGIGLGAPAGEAGAQLAELVDDTAPHLRPLLPLIALAMGGDVEATSEVDAIGAEFRRQRLHEAVGELVAAIGRRAVFVAEDLHWADDASGELLVHLLGMAAAQGWSAIVTRRPSGTWSLAPEVGGSERLELKPLGADAVSRLAIRSARRSLTDGEIRAVTERADGNPLFAIELARTITSSSIDDVPDSVEQVISTRLDDLDPEIRHLIRVASVMGHAFSAADIAPVLEALSISRTLEEASGVDVLVSREVGEWEFAHALYRDVAYEGLPFSQRQSLHSLCGEVLESRAESIDDVAPLLSLHFFEARDARRAWEYSTMAGRAAFAQHAYADAAVALDRAIAASRRLRSVEAQARVEVAVELAEANAIIGDFDGARTVLQTARRLNDVVAVEVDLMRRLGDVAEREGRLSDALRWYTRAEAKIHRDSGDDEELRSRAKIRLAKAGILHRRSDNHGCARESHAALADAERAQDHEVRAQAYGRLHLAHVYTRSRYADFYGTSALESFEAIGDSNAQTSVLNNFGIQRYLAGEWSAASSFYARAAELGSAVGNVVFAGSANLNRGEILSDQGRWREAIELYERARRNWSAVGYPTGIAAADLFEGVARARLAESDVARRLLTSAGSAFQALTIPGLVEETEIRLVELDAVDRPADLVGRRVELEARYRPKPESWPRVSRAIGVASHSVGDRDAARRLLLAALASSEETGLDRALTLDALVRLFPHDADCLEWRAAQSAIVAVLDIVEFPPVSTDITPG